MSDGERIAKVMARAGLASRRQAEQWIADGRVSVNGAVISSPALNVTPQDKIAVDGTPLRARERTRLFLYHKPRNLMTTHSDPEGRPTIFAALPKNLPRLISVGRLDYNTEGLLLLTNDGALARVLELPKTAWVRRYRVRALGRITQDKLDSIRGGVTIEGTRYGAIEATLDREQGANVWLSFAIKEGKNREVRNVLLHLGLQVNRLIRVGFGPFELDELDDGEVEEVPTDKLRAMLGDAIVKESGADFAGPMLEHDPKARRAETRNAQSQAAKGDSASSPKAASRPPRDDAKRRRQNFSARRDRSSGPRPSRPKPSSKPRAEPQDER
jgi:23S rRNA pseudouridine2605 synthase